MALVSLATLVLELTLTRLFSATMFYHFAFLAISLALVACLPVATAYVPDTERGLGGGVGLRFLLGGPTETPSSRSPPRSRGGATSPRKATARGPTGPSAPVGTGIELAVRFGGRRTGR